MYRSSNFLYGSEDKVRNAFGGSYAYFNISKYFESYSEDPYISVLSTALKSLGSMISDDVIGTTWIDTQGANTANYWAVSALDLIGSMGQFPPADMPAVDIFSEYDPVTETYNTTPFVQEVYVKPQEWVGEISDDLIYPSLSAPVLLIGNEFSIVDDLHWKKIIAGGLYNQREYAGINTHDQVFPGLNTSITLPYEKLESRLYAAEHDKDYITYEYLQIESKYNIYVPELQNKECTIYELPNLYLLTYYSSYPALSNQPIAYSDELKEFCSLNGYYTSGILETNLGLNGRQYPFPPPVPAKGTMMHGGDFLDDQYYMREYYWKWAQTDFSEKTLDAVSEQMKNIFLEPKATKGVALGVLNSEENIPLGVDIQIPREKQSTGCGLIHSIFNDQFQHVLMFHIKDKFVNNTPLQLDVLEVAKSEEEEQTGAGISQQETYDRLRATMGGDAMIRYMVERGTMLDGKGGETKLNYVDFSKILLEEVNNPKFGIKDFIYIGGSTGFNIEMIKDNENAANYRYLRTSLANTMILNTQDYLKGIMDTQGDDIFPVNHRHDGSNWTAGPDPWSLNDFLWQPEMIDESLYGGCVGFRIEKTMIAPSQNNTAKSAVVQNIYIPSDPNQADILRYFDTQVHYGETYKYKIYRYELAVSYRYSYKDLKISEQIAINNKKYCLSFYDPVTNQSKNLAWYINPEDPSWVPGSPIENVAAHAITTGAPTFASDAEAISGHPYIAEMVLQIEPNIAIYEIPTHEKEITILDNPPQSVDITPFQRKDDSQIIGFLVRKEEFYKALYPSPLNSKETKLGQSYLESNNLLPSEEIIKPSISALRYLQVFRLDRKPKSIKDFDNFMIEEKDLKIMPDNAFEEEANTSYPFYHTTQASPICFYEEKIQSNKTYYYLFRFLNEHRMPGRVGPIYAITLMDDGGYKYLQSEVIQESDLSHNSDVYSASKDFKKIFQFLPTIEQIQLETKAVDHEATALSQLDKIEIGDPTLKESIWGKTFKIRLTSKKTAKKVDLNVTYNLKDRY
tara:strand:+ start:82383 stop:85448 length:3066 start_codon:yes stop_codon:yes gene_type:complete